MRKIYLNGEEHPTGPQEPLDSATKDYTALLSDIRTFMHATGQETAFERWGGNEKQKVN